MKFVTNQIMKDLNSVHLSNFPDVSNISDEKDLVEIMDRVRNICNAALSIRNDKNIRIRQPLSDLLVIDSKCELLKDYIKIIEEELNVKSVSLSNDIDSYASLALNINFPVLGKRLPTKMKQIIASSKKGEWERLDNGNIKILDEELTGEECQLKLVPKDKNNSAPLGSNDALVILDLNITEDLKYEGIARDLVRIIQQSRREADLHISDHIEIIIDSDNKEIIESVNKFADGNDYSISQQTLADNISFSDTASCVYKDKFEIAGTNINLGFNLVVNKKAAAY